MTKENTAVAGVRVRVEPGYFTPTEDTYRPSVHIAFAGSSADQFRLTGDVQSALEKALRASLREYGDRWSRNGAVVSVFVYGPKVHKSDEEARDDADNQLIENLVCKALDLKVMPRCNSRWRDNSKF